MRSPAAAIAWQFRQRHRRGLLALGAYLLVLAAIKFLLPGSTNFRSAEDFAFLVIVPMTATFIYFLAIFTFGLEGDLAARESMYPRRMFALPLTDSALAGWPMLFGLAAMALLWAATRLLALWPAGADVPVAWPALLGAVLLAWTQALLWMPYPLRGLRVVAAVLWLCAVDGAVLVALQLRAGELAMLAILAPQLPVAFVLARSAVARGRRGEVPEWRAAVRSRSGSRQHFRSPAAAQSWFEWRRFGRSLPALVAILLPFELAMLFVFRDTAEIVVETILCVVLTPPFMALFTAATVSKSGGDSYSVTAFAATRPLSSASLVAAKLKAAMWSTAAAWLLVVVAVPVALKLSGTLPMAIERIRLLGAIFGTARASAILLLAFGILLLTTWKVLVQALYVGVSGREWLVKASVFVPLALLVVVGPIAHRIADSREAIARLWNAFPWILGALVCAKISTSIAIGLRLYNERLITGRALLAAALCWDAAVFALYGVLAWIFPEIIVRHYVLALLAILAIPLARLSAAPLALSWNRHR